MTNANIFPPVDTEIKNPNPEQQDASDTGQAGAGPRVPSFGPIFLTCAVFSTALTLGWLYLPEEALPFGKTSLIGFSVISLLRMFFCLLLPTAIFAWRYRIPDEDILGKNPGIGAFLLSIIAGIPISVILTAIHNLLVRFFITKGLAIAAPAFFCSSDDTSALSRLLLAGVAILIPVLLQELFFRGALFASWPKPERKNTQIFAGAGLFALYLLQPVDFIPLLLLGLLLGMIRQATDNLLCPIMTQASMLLTSYVFSPLLPALDWTKIRSAADLDAASLYAPSAALVISMIAFLPVLAQLRSLSRESGRIEKLRSRTSGSESAAADRGRRPALGWMFWLGVLLFSACWALLLCR